jgi:hypothetical protein
MCISKGFPRQSALDTFCLSHTCTRQDVLTHTTMYQYILPHTSAPNTHHHVPQYYTCKCTTHTCTPHTTKLCSQSSVAPLYMFMGFSLSCLSYQCSLMKGICWKSECRFKECRCHYFLPFPPSEEGQMYSTIFLICSCSFRVQFVAPYFP